MRLSIWASGGGSSDGHHRQRHLIEKVERRGCRCIPWAGQQRSDAKSRCLSRALTGDSPPPPQRGRRRALRPHHRRQLQPDGVRHHPVHQADMRGDKTHAPDVHPALGPEGRLRSAHRAASLSLRRVRGPREYGMPAWETEPVAGYVFRNLKTLDS